MIWNTLGIELAIEAKRSGNQGTETWNERVAATPQAYTAVDPEEGKSKVRIVQTLLKVKQTGDKSCGAALRCTESTRGKP